MSAEFFAAGECALTIRLGHEISPEINQKVHALGTVRPRKQRKLQALKSILKNLLF